jgi:pimeloyl-ACP methyl ester carboxylesterase
MSIGGTPRHLVELDRLRHAASCVTIPVLVVRGMQSDVTSDDGMIDMLQLIPDAETTEVKSAGHMVPGDDNEVFTDQLMAFLSRLVE